MKWFRYVLTLVMGASLFGLGQNPSYQPDPEWRVPAPANSRSNPLTDKPDTARGGKKLFVRHCAECHGNDGAGLMNKRSADFHLAIVQEQSDGTLFWKITNGNAERGMPSFSKLPELQRWQLVLFIRTLKATGPAAADPGK